MTDTALPSIVRGAEDDGPEPFTHDAAARPQGLEPASLSIGETSEA